MARSLITIGLLVLVTTAATVLQTTPSNGVLQLSYNPTYDLWFFIPSGRPDKLNQNIKDAYMERRPGGVCFIPEDDWFFCATEEKIQ